MLHKVICLEHKVYNVYRLCFIPSQRLERVSNHGFGKIINLELVIKFAQRSCKAESTSSHFAGVASIVDLFCLVPCHEFVLIIYDHIAHVMSILSVHITDVYRLFLSWNIIVHNLYAELWLSS